MEIVILIAYTLALLFIFFYSLVQLHLVYLYLKSRNNQPSSSSVQKISSDTALPFVTVQLPIYNELYVVKRLIDAVARFNYPKACFEIQVLDDSVDETTDIIAEQVKYWQQQGVQIYHIQREDRTGYKAGALQEGLKTAKGKFIAIFDADFIPDRNFLQRTLPHFEEDAQLGVVQTRWEHVNQNYSLLTQLQAFGLDAHFTVEQGGRNTGNYFINFNGTAGIWRKACIKDAGGWQADTLTEDLDLSYRAQLKEWRFKYLEEVNAPAELPVTMHALKSQQFRWTKGAAETARKNLFQVLKAPISFPKKVHATFHLLNSSVFICVLIVAVLSVPILWLKNSMTLYALYFKLASFFLISLIILGGFYWVSLVRKYQSFWRIFKQFTVKFPMFLAISMGISLHNALAVIEGYLGFKTPFIRTPKFNIQHINDHWQQKKYLDHKISILTVFEGLFALYFLLAMVLGIYLNDFGLFLFHLLLFLGFGIVFYYSVKHTFVSLPSNSP